jgi:hypothetical protein
METNARIVLFFFEVAEPQVQKHVLRYTTLLLAVLPACL